MKQTSVLAVALLVTTILFSCKTKSAEEKLPLNEIVQVDLSGSRIPPVTNWFKEIISFNVILKLDKNGAIGILPTDSASLQGGQEIAVADFSKNDYHNEFAGNDKEKVEMNIHRDSLKAFQQRFSLAFDSMLARRKFQNGTDITGGLELAKKYYLPNHENIIILFSDMLIYHNYGKGLIDFEHNLNDTSEINCFISKVPQMDLSGWKVIVITGQSNISATKYSAVEGFWERYFEMCHGKLELYTCCSVSLLEKELKR